MQNSGYYYFCNGRECYRDGYGKEFDVEKVNGRRVMIEKTPPSVIELASNIDSLTIRPPRTPADQLRSELSALRSTQSYISPSEFSSRYMLDIGSRPRLGTSSNLMVTSSPNYNPTEALVDVAILKSSVGLPYVAGSSFNSNMGRLAAASTNNKSKYKSGRITVQNLDHHWKSSGADNYSVQAYRHKYPGGSKGSHRKILLDHLIKTWRAGAIIVEESLHYLPYFISRSPGSRDYDKLAEILLDQLESPNNKSVAAIHLLNIVYWYSDDFEKFFESQDYYGTSDNYFCKDIGKFLYSKVCQL